jgi:hypothetical protein
MRHLLRVCCLLAVLAFSGCAFNRSDFVAGPDGKPNDDELSGPGKTIRDFFKNGLRARIASY